MSLETLHQKVHEVCQTDFGVGIRIELLDRSVQRELRELSSTSFASGLPTSFSGLEASVGIDPSDVSIAVNSVEQRLDVNAALLVTVHLPAEPLQHLGKYRLMFSDAIARIVEDPRLGGKLAIALETRGRYQMNANPRPLEFENRLIQQGIVDADGNADVARYDRFEAAAFFFDPDSFLESLLAAVSVPELVQSLRTIRLASPLVVDFIDTHIIVHSPNVVLDSPSCPRSKFMEEELAFQRVETHGAQQIQVKLAEAEVRDPLDLNARVAATLDSSDLEGALLYHYPKGVLFDWSFGSLKPSVTISDRGNKYGIYWFYNMSAALRRIAVSFRATSPTTATVLVEAPVEINGNAGAGVEIACVKYEVLSVRCNGDVDPLEIEVSGGLDTRESEVFIHGKVRQAQVDLDWRTNFGFPFDQISDWLLDRILDREVRKVVGRQVTLYRRDLSELRDLLSSIGLYLGRFESNAIPDESILFAIGLREG